MGVGRGGPAMQDDPGQGLGVGGGQPVLDPCGAAAATAELAFAAFSNTARIKDGLIPADGATLARIILHGGSVAADAQDRRA